MPHNTVILDVDNVVADFTTHLLSFVKTPLTRADIKKYDIFWYLDVDATSHAHSVLGSPSFWACLPLIPGASEGVQKIRAAGLNILWATSPWVPCIGWDTARCGWLRMHFGAESHDVMIGSAKQHLVGCAFLDDVPSHVLKWRKVHGDARAFLFDSHHNQDADTSLTRIDWSSIDRLIAAATANR